MRDRFRDLHDSGFFVIPNPWDVGSGVLLESLGFAALATTSSGLAASLGLADGEVTLDQLVDHVAALTAAVGVPVSVDAERCFAADATGIGTIVDRLAAAGAAGLSIEDWSPGGGVDPLPVAVERVAAAVQAARAHGLVVTARAENLIRGVDDLPDTISRLQAYEVAGADVVYAPGLRTLEQVAAVVAAVTVPVNVLLLPGGPTPPELAAAGVRRASTGGALARVAYRAASEAAAALLRT